MWIRFDVDEHGCGQGSLALMLPLFSGDTSSPPRLGGNTRGWRMSMTRGKIVPAFCLSVEIWSPSVDKV